jgi:hypothetical protein
MAQTQFFPITSSNLDSAAFDRDWNELVVRFKNGTAYKYQDVTQSLWADFKKRLTERADRPAAFSRSRSGF